MQEERTTAPGASPGKTGLTLRKVALGVAVLALLGIGVALFLRLGQPGTPVRIVLKQPREAPDFALQDQRGEIFRLSEARGKVVVLAFLYTSCGDVCPFISVKLRMAMDLLGDEAGKAEFVVVTVDPQRDTLQRVAEYSRELGLYDRWHYLTGSREELLPVWDGYPGEPGVTTDRQQLVPQEELEAGLLRGLDEPMLNDANQAREKFGGGYGVTHNALTYLIDPGGQIRVLLGSDLAPDDLVKDIKLLLK